MAQEGQSARTARRTVALRPLGCTQRRLLMPTCALPVPPSGCQWPARWCRFVGLAFSTRDAPGTSDTCSQRQEQRAFGFGLNVLRTRRTSCTGMPPSDDVGHLLRAKRRGGV